MLDRHAAVKAAIPLVAEVDAYPGQIGIVVDDLDRALATWGSIGHTEPGWRIWTYGPSTVSAQTYRGRPAPHSMRLAMAGRNPQLELIQPLEPPTIYHDWLADRGPGMHHIGLYVDDVAASTATMVEAGFEMIQSGAATGADGSGAYAYFDTVELLGFYLEAIEVPKVRREPERVWPSAPGRDSEG